LTLTSLNHYPLQPLVESAIANEVRLLEAALRQTEARLRACEAEHGLTTSEFVARYANDQIDETLETIEWLGEYRMAQRIQQKLAALRSERLSDLADAQP
jgi:hypothetical protein